MKVLLKHHYGWRTYDIPEAKDIHDAAYRAVRKSHEFLTDSNHTHTAEERSIQWGGKMSTFMSVLIYRTDEAPPYTGPSWAETDYWFAVEYMDPDQLG